MNIQDWCLLLQISKLTCLKLKVSGWFSHFKVEVTLIVPSVAGKPCASILPVTEVTSDPVTIDDLERYFFYKKQILLTSMEKILTITHDNFSSALNNHQRAHFSSISLLNIFIIFLLCFSIFLFSC